MTREEVRAKVLELAESVQAFTDWDAESDRPKTVEIEFDSVWKLVVVWENGFRTIKIHECQQAG
jgi:hypothetical protein